MDLAQRIPDLSTGAFQLGDILVALEWLRTEWPVMVESGSGDFVVLDCKQFIKEVWTEAIELSLHRGLTSIRTSGPLWLLQLAGQDVETWPFVGERPIFTQHLPDQFKLDAAGLVRSPASAVTLAGSAVACVAVLHIAG